MPRRRPERLRHVAGIGVDRMASIADTSARDLLRLENLDTDVPPAPEAIARTREAAAEDPARRDTVASELRGLSFGLPGGGWSMLLDVSGHGLDGEAMSRRLLEEGVCATAMTGWGERHGAQYVRLVYANEPVERVSVLGARVRAALGADGPGGPARPGVASR